MLGSLKNSIMPHLLPFFRLQWASLCSRNRDRPNLDERKGPKYRAWNSRSSPSTKSNAQFRLAIHLRQVILENCRGNINGRENVGNQTYRQGDRKAPDGPGAEQKEEESGNDRRDVSIDDGQEGFVKAGLHGGRRRFPIAQLLANTLEHQYVRIYAHADGQNDA